MNVTNKLSFSIKNIELIEENPDSNFAILSLDFFASGNNLHNLYVSDETLRRTADTIKNCPLVWKYDEILDDIYTHDKDEVPCGFVPETSEIIEKKMSDGRTMLSTIAYVWKRYTGQLLNIFKRDGGNKPVSVEMSVFDIQRRPDGMKELKDFRFEGITVLGSYVTPAIPLANAQVVSFAEIEKEYIEDYKKEFSQKSIQLPNGLIEEFRKDGILLTFPYKSMEDVNPAIKGIEPPVTLAQANQISNVADTIGSDKEKNGWAIAISQFKKTHRVVDGKWVKKEGSSAQSSFTDEDNLAVEEMTMEKGTENILENSSKTIISENNSVTPVTTDTIIVDMAEEEKPEEEKPEEEKPEEEKPEEEDKEEDKKEDKEEDMSLFDYPQDIDMEIMSQIFTEDENEVVKMAFDELQKGKLANPVILMSGMFAKMREMAGTIEKMAGDTEAYIEELNELKSFKAEIEKSQKQYAVDEFMQELGKKIVISEEAREEMVAKAEEYDYSNLEAWKNYCKVYSFDFAVRETSKSDVVKVGMPWADVSSTKKDNLWA